MTAMGTLKFILTRRRLVYHFFSGLMFLALSVTLFFWSGRLVTFFNVRLFSILLFAYAAYRFIVFTWLLRKELRDTGNGDHPQSCV